MVAKTLSTIATNRRASFDYHIEERFEGGIVLRGWEVKSLRAGRVQLNGSHVLIRRGEAWLIACHIQALPTVGSDLESDPLRTRKLLLKRRELARLSGSVERRGKALVALSMHWSKGRAKLCLGIGLGKKQQDKREGIKNRLWQREQNRLLKQRHR